MKIDGLGVHRGGRAAGRQVRRDRCATRRATARRTAQRGPAARPRLVEAHKVAQAYYADAARHARRGRGARSSWASAASTRPPPSSSASASRRATVTPCYGTCGRRASPTRRRVAGGLVARAGRRYDRFRGRLLWPIRETSGDDDRLRRPPDLRRRPDRGEVPQHPRDRRSTRRARCSTASTWPAATSPARSQAVVVEGYTDVMACHLVRRPHRGRHLRYGVRRRPRPGAAPVPQRPRGVPRRGDLHLRRRRGRAEGRAAGLRRRPELRRPDLRRGRADRPRPLRPAASSRATRPCASCRAPASRSTASCSRTSSRKYDLDRADGRVDAVREAARLVSSIRDKSKVEAFARELAGMVGVDVEQARTEVRRAAGRAARPAPQPPAAAAAAAPRSAATPARAAAARPARPAVRARARDPQARRTAARGRGPDDQRHRRQRLHPPDLPRRLGAGRAVRRARRRRRRLGRAAHRRGVRPGRRGRAVGARGRAGAEPQGRRRRVRRQHASTASRSSPRSAGSPR